MSFYDRFGQFVDDVTGKTNDAIEMGRLNTKIHGERVKSDRMKKRLGQFYYEQHKNGGQIEPGAMEYVVAIEESETLITKFKSEIERLKKEFGADPKEKNEQAPYREIKICGNCFKDNGKDAQYCQQCGEPLQDWDEEA